MGTIYLITNKLNGKQYVGQTTRTVEQRIKEHIQEAQNSCRRRNLHLYNAIRKYGVENFSFEVLETNLNESELDEYEIKYIKKYNTLKNGYNNTIGGGGIKGYKHTQLTKDKISQSLLNHPERYTEERSRKISYALKGVPKSLEHRKKLSMARIGKCTKEQNGFYNKHHTAESKQKMHESSIKYLVEQIDLSTHNIIQVFDCVEDGAKYLIDNNFTRAKLSSVMYRIYYTCAGKQSYAYGFGWKYQERCNDYPITEYGGR